MTGEIPIATITTYLGCLEVFSDHIKAAVRFGDGELQAEGKIAAEDLFLYLQSPCRLQLNGILALNPFEEGRWITIIVWGGAHPPAMFRISRNELREKIEQIVEN